MEQWTQGDVHTDGIITSGGLIFASMGNFFMFLSGCNYAQYMAPPVRTRRSWAGNAAAGTSTRGHAGAPACCAAAGGWGKPLPSRRPGITPCRRPMRCCPCCLSPCPQASHSNNMSGVDIGQLNGKGLNGKGLPSHDDDASLDV